MNNWLWIILLSLMPVSELRGALVFGFSQGLSLPFLLVVSIVFNIFAAFFAFVFVRYIVKQFLHIGWFKRFWERIILRSQRKVHHSIEKYGMLGLVLFIGIPLPGTGVYTAAIGANALGFSFRRFFVASVIGVLMSVTIVTLILVSGEAVFVRFIS